MMDPALDASLKELEEVMQQNDWQTADALTLEILLEQTNRQRQGWLDADAIAQLSCDVLHHLDQRWLFYSSGQFGFSIQLQLYQMLERSARTFSREVGWTVSLWRPTSFFTFYSLLTFSLEAPVGHLPALWYWELPWYRSWLLGGFGTGRGAGFGDPDYFDTLMLRLERCQQV
jgi:hypothetical protein